MPGFVLSEEVSALEYNFEPYAGKGTIPEPTSDQIAAFRKSLGELVQAELPAGVRSADDMAQADLAQTLSMYLNRDTTEIDEKVLHMASAVCSDHPTFDELATLPFRARQAFLGWLVGILLVPEVPMPATNT
jgi:hypothetical protein